MSTSKSESSEGRWREKQTASGKREVFHQKLAGGRETKKMHLICPISSHGGAGRGGD